MIVSNSSTSASLSKAGRLMRVKGIDPSSNSINPTLPAVIMSSGQDVAGFRASS